MDKEAVEFVLAALPNGRTVFYDFPDRYAVLLLSQQLESGSASVAELKRSNLAPLLNKPVIKNVLSKIGRTTVSEEDFAATWPSRVDGYRLTLDSWPTLSKKPNRAWHQTTRLGY